MKFTLKNSLIMALAAFSALTAAQTAFGAQIAEQRKKTIIWDLGYVLTKDNKLKMSSYIIPQTCGWNPYNLVRLGLLAKYGCFTPKAIQTTMDNVLHNARPNEPRQTVIVNQHGEPHANIDCDHQVAAKTDKELFAEAQASINQLAAADTLKTNWNDLFFKNPAHKYLVEATFKLRLMEPQFFGESFTPIKEGVALLERCAANENNTMAILSNWGAESFPYLKQYKNNEPIFKHFRSENIFHSGSIKFAKPHQEAYTHVINKMGVQPQDCIFIDDQIKNVEAARAVGMNAIHLTDYKNPASYQAVEQELKRLGAL